MQKNTDLSRTCGPCRGRNFHTCETIRSSHGLSSRRPPRNRRKIKYNNLKKLQEQCKENDSTKECKAKICTVRIVACAALPQNSIKPTKPARKMNRCLQSVESFPFDVSHVTPFFDPLLWVQICWKSRHFAFFSIE
jgi:hypothetical protein